MGASPEAKTVSVAVSGWRITMFLVFEATLENTLRVMLAGPHAPAGASQVTLRFPKHYCSERPERLIDFRDAVELKVFL